MAKRYSDLIDQTFHFPQDGFQVKAGQLNFNGIPLRSLIKKYGTPLKITYLPKIGEQVDNARNWFNEAIRNNGYTGKYYYCYCTKSCHFNYVLQEVIHCGTHLETSSVFDLEIIEKLHAQGELEKGRIIVCNGFKNEKYIDKIIDLSDKGFYNILPVLDNADEYDILAENSEGPLKLGIRLATNEEPNRDFYTSRLGFGESELFEFVSECIVESDRADLKMLHFFIDTGIKDTIYYWSEFERCLRIYCELKRICPSLKAINIGGGLPIRNSLGFEFDYKSMIDKIVNQIQEVCEEMGFDEPDIFTEFGKFTIGESDAIIFEVLGQKLQNDSELWYMVDNSVMNTIPDSWGLNERFILLPINKWNNEYTRVNIGGMSCDSSDFYNSDAHANLVYLPKVDGKSKEPLYLGFFHTGAYQDSLSGYGGVKHCLIPSPKHVLVDIDEDGRWFDTLYRDEQTTDDVLRILGYLND